MGQAKLIKAKKGCCKSKPRCKKCPVVCKRLVGAGLATKTGDRRFVVQKHAGKKALKAARAR